MLDEGCMQVWKNVIVARVSHRPLALIELSLYTIMLVFSGNSVSVSSSAIDLKMKLTVRQIIQMKLIDIYC